MNQLTREIENIIKAIHLLSTDELYKLVSLIGKLPIHQPETNEKNIIRILEAYEEDNSLRDVIYRFLEDHITDKETNSISSIDAMEYDEMYFGHPPIYLERDLYLTAEEYFHYHLSFENQKIKKDIKYEIKLRFTNLLIKIIEQLDINPNSIEDFLFDWKIITNTEKADIGDNYKPVLFKLLFDIKYQHLIAANLLDYINNDQIKELDFTLEEVLDIFCFNIYFYSNKKILISTFNEDILSFYLQKYNIPYTIPTNFKFSISCEMDDLKEILPEYYSNLLRLYYQKVNGIGYERMIKIQEIRDYKKSHDIKYQDTLPTNQKCKNEN